MVRLTCCETWTSTATKFQFVVDWLLKQAMRLSSTRAGGWFFTHITPGFDRWLLKSSAGRWNISLGQAPILLLTTVGRKSGQPKQTPVLFLQDEKHKQVLYLIASNGGQANFPAWYLNLSANPQAEILMQGHHYSAQADELEAENYHLQWQNFLEFNPGFARYKDRLTRHIPIVRLTINCAN